jgi:iron complex outermembrane receptor protein
MQAEKPNPAALRRLTTGVVAILLCVQAPVFAQTASTTTTTTSDDTAGSDVVRLEEFKVTSGFASSLAAAAAAKQAAPTIVDVIAAEDIGKLPDVSIADSLTRLPGLTTQRVNGRSQGITIRGLVGDFTVGTLNGREQVSTSNNRDIEWDQFPAEFVNQATVLKSASAHDVAQGLAGTIDLQFPRPLSKPTRVLALGASYNWTQYAQLTPGVKAKGETETVAYIDQFNDRKVGVAVALTHAITPWEGEQFQAWGYPTDSSGNYVLGGTKSYVRTSDLSRTGLMGVIEFKPSDNVHSTIDIFVSKYEEKQMLRGMEIPLWWSGAQFQPGYTVVNGLATDGTYRNVQPVVRNDVFKRNDSPVSFGWNLKLGEKSEWPVTFDAGYSRVNRSDINLETYSGLGLRANAAHPDTMRVQLIPGEIPIITPTLTGYADGSILKLTDPQGWGPSTLPGQGMYGYLKFEKSKDELGQFKLNTAHELKGPFNKFEVGGSYTDHYKRDGEGPSGWINTPHGEVTMPLPPKIGTTDMSFLGIGNIYAYDPLAAYYGGTWGFTNNPDTGIVATRFDVEEKISQVFAQLDIDTKIAGLPLRGDVGGRLIHSDQKAKGYSAAGTTLNPVQDEAKYNDFAPALNLALNVTPETMVRLSLSRQLARPRMYDMRAARSWGLNPTLVNSTDLAHSPWSGSGGNTHLRPWKSDSIDLSLEHYFAEHRGSFAITAFHKKLLTYIYTAASPADFTGYPTNGLNPVLHEGVVTQPVNGAGGSIQGIEASMNLTSELISHSLHGLGLQVNGAYTDSSVKPWGPGNGDAPIAGLSRKNGNATIYYERHGFAVRLSERYRGSTREYITTFGPVNRGGDTSPNNGFSVAQPEKVVDGQISYEFQHGPLKNLTLYLQAYNLNNSPLITYNNGDPRQVINYQKYGASYSVRASYKF